MLEQYGGGDRELITGLVDAFEVENPGTKQERKVLRLSPMIAPVKAAILPLVNRDGMPEIARKITDELKPHLKIFYDGGGSVGRRYRRQDEAGTPWCSTVDGDTNEQGTVTIRERDSMEQSRVALDKVVGWIRERLAG